MNVIFLTSVALGVGDGGKSTVEWSKCSRCLTDECQWVFLTCAELGGWGWGGGGGERAEGEGTASSYRNHLVIQLPWAHSRCCFLVKQSHSVSASLTNLTSPAGTYPKADMASIPFFLSLNLCPRNWALGESCTRVFSSTISFIQAAETAFHIHKQKQNKFPPQANNYT